MIFVTVGTDEHNFSRLVKEVDKIAPEIGNDIVVQLGYTQYEPRNCKSFHFTSFERIEKLNQKSNIIITHAGAGSIIKALKYGKRPIVVPRRKKYNEHINDHQLDLAKKMSKEDKIILCKDPKDLNKVLTDDEDFEYNRKGGSTKLVKIIRRILVE